MKLVSEMGLNSQNVTSVIDGGVSGETRFPQKSHCQIRAFELFELSEMAAGEQFRLSRRKNIPPKFICRFFFQAEDGIRDKLVTGVQTCALPILPYDPVSSAPARAGRMARQREIEIEHLLRRAGFGATEQEVNDYAQLAFLGFSTAAARSEERRVGKECSARGSAGRYRKTEKEID